MPDKPFKLVMTKIVSEHSTERAAKTAMRKHRAPRKGEKLVIVREAKR